MLVLRYGLCSHRRSQIFQAGSTPAEQIVLKARREAAHMGPPYAPPPAAEVAQRIREARPQAVFTPHVETASGIILPADYIRAVADAAHEVGALMTLDGVASGCMWPDMAALDVDVLVSAPQKNWSAAPGAGLVMLGERALPHCAPGRSRASPQTSAAGSRSWRPTWREVEGIGLDRLRDAQETLGAAVRRRLARRGFASVAQAGFGGPGVVVSYTRDPDIQSGRRFADAGVQIAPGVPLMLDEGEDFRSFRLGLFGLDKLLDPEATLARLELSFDQALGPADRSDSGP